MTLCQQAGCSGTIAADGYCDTCGFAASHQPAAAASPPPAPAAATTPPPPGAPRAAAPVGAPVAGNACRQPGCGGSIAGDGYCDTCGMAAAAAAPAAAPTPSSSSAALVTAASLAAPAPPALSSRLAQTGATSATRRSSASLRTSTTQTALGLGLVNVTPTAVGDPERAVMTSEKIQTVLGEVPEEERHCNACGRPVGRAQGGEPGRITGFCGSCRTPFDFVTNMPSLQAGELVAGQYNILGPIAHGGMGWIYLGRDKAVADRWVVLKGLLNEDDEDAIASAVAERQFLARIEHGSVVNIYNFVTWGGAGYIVMEYVGGQSLNSKLKQRRRENGGQPHPLPVAEAIAYMLGVLPALGYLHDLGLIYNDLKPANVMATGDSVKLIDVGGVMQIDDHGAAIFGTQGFQAPEVPTIGPSIASDLYTVGRTLAVLTLKFKYHEGQFQYSLPSQVDEPLFQQWESFYRFLLKATAPHPDDRFQSADEMMLQLTGVLREVVAITDGTPRPAPSSLFYGDRLTDVLVDASAETTVVEPEWSALPLPRIAATDAASAFLMDLPDDDPQRAVDSINAALDERRIEPSMEVALVQAHALVEIGRDPTAILTQTASIDPWEWRTQWIYALADLRDGKAAEAAEGFSSVWTDLPGEIAPKLAVALSAEVAGDYARAAGLYASVVATDPTYVSASFGLARCRAADGDRTGAAAAYGQVPASSSSYTEAQVASTRTMVLERPATDIPTAEELAGAASTIERLQLDAAERARLATEILEKALHGLEAGKITGRNDVTLFGSPLNEDGIRRGLESGYRELARVAPTSAERFALIDRANTIRPRSLF